MKALITLIILLAVFWVGKKLATSYREIEKRQSPNQETPAPPAPPPGASLPGLPPALEPSLSAAQQQGAAGLREWLRLYRNQVRDPRLAAIELDYVVLISRQNPAEARRIYEDVKNRTPTFSPIYDRVKRLEKTYE